MNKLKKVQVELEKKDLDGILITSAINREYITGFTGTAGAVLINKDQAIFMTDFRYTEQAAEQAVNFEIIEHKETLEKEIANQLTKLNIKRLAFEETQVTYATYDLYKKTFDAELVPTRDLIENLRIFKSEKELQIMRKAAEIADKAFEHIQTFIKPGVKEIDVSNELEFFMRKLGATSSSFDTIVASGLRSALPHGVASEKEIKNGELVTLDYGALYKGYCSDITRTVSVGEISDELREIYETVLHAQKLGVEKIGPGITGKEADSITRNYIIDKGYGKYFGHSTGHGLGMEVHEAPSLSHRSNMELKPNMVVTVEPGIYIPDVGGCRIEDDIVITETGNVRLSNSTKELIQL